MLKIARVKRIELLSTVLETAILPLEDTRMKAESNRFELLNRFRLLVFKTNGLSHSPNSLGTKKKDC